MNCRQLELLGEVHSRDNLDASAMEARHGQLDVRQTMVAPCALSPIRTLSSAKGNFTKAKVQVRVARIAGRRQLAFTAIRPI
ncbi:hypothetical protein SNOG_14814 [Parastagonospora nodorum SN15]|uniref:Uncharacterized protein n=1 Tax=Phaeosphaeria nodorum (strain SN15 / ATCC MYA-4574 / FGSC 10173) TaxID=321614 RepID=Q0TZV8_PHANO|nr:hypothetical protein SNOG_14814 [Parastagonospora nodorum SN15]EAT77666.1 hypothetical protein SNOG_14814 [Parastagonospora nodorum SN15]